MTEERDALAIDGGTPLRTTPWPDASRVSPAEDPDPVEALERALAHELGLAPAEVIAYADPSEAYRAALSIVPLGERNEVVIPCLQEDRAAEAARAVGWRVVPGEIEADTAALSVRGLARAAGERTALAVIGHAFGHPAVMHELTRIAQEHGLAVVEDITGALGASFRGQPAGRMGHAAVMEGRAGDPITRGAYLLIPDAEAASNARAARSASPSEDDARVALAEVRGLQEELTHRRHLAWELTFGLRGMKGVTAMPHSRWVHHAYARYVVRLRSLVWKRSLDDTIAALRAEGIPCERACGASLHRDAAILDALPGDVRVGEDVFPVASRLPGELIAFGLHAGLTSKDMDQVAAALRKVEAKSI